MFEQGHTMEEKISTVIISSAISGLITFIFGYYLGRRNARYQEFLRASREFREPFIDALIELDPIEDTKDGYTIDTFSFNIAIKHFEKQRLAVKTFSNYLSSRKRIKLNNAWNEYAYPNENKFPGDFNEIGFDYKTVNPAEEPEIRERMRKRINKIISFGKY
jgi:hypothetical protein